MGGRKGRELVMMIGMENGIGWIDKLGGRGKGGRNRNFFFFRSYSYFDIYFFFVIFYKK